MSTLCRISAVDYHTAGEPFRIVEDLPFQLEGGTVAQRRNAADNDARARALRAFLAFEPRGHQNMYGGWILPPNDAGAHFGVLFWYSDGFPRACGHGSIALGVWAIESGRVRPSKDGVTDVVMDVPAGRITVRVATDRGVVTGATYLGVPSFVIEPSRVVTTSRGELTLGVANSGSPLLSADLASCELSIAREQLPAFVDLYRELRDVTVRAEVPQAPFDIVTFHEDLGETPTGDLRQRAVTIFGDGRIDRSPCGTGTACRTAMLTSAGTLRPGKVLRHYSVLGTEFVGSVSGHVVIDGREHFVTNVSGMAYRTGEHVFVASEDDPLASGFLLG